MIAGEVELVSKSFPVVFSGGENPSLIAITSLGGGCLAINSEENGLRVMFLVFKKIPFFTC